MKLLWYIGMIYRDNGKENGNYCVYHRGIQGHNIGIMEKNMETTVVYWSDIAFRADALLLA